jgi:hypothetical protein
MEFVILLLKYTALQVVIEIMPKRYGIVRALSTCVIDNKIASKTTPFGPRLAAVSDPSDSNPLD